MTPLTLTRIAATIYQNAKGKWTNRPKRPLADDLAAVLAEVDRLTALVESLSNPAKPRSPFGMNVSTLGTWDNRASFYLTDMFAGEVYRRSDGQLAKLSADNRPLEPCWFGGFPFWYLDPVDVGRTALWRLPAKLDLGMLWTFAGRYGVTLEDRGTTGDVRTIAVTWTKAFGYAEDGGALPSGAPDALREVSLSLDAAAIQIIADCSEPMSMRWEGETGHLRAQAVARRAGHAGTRVDLDMYRRNHDVTRHIDWAADQKPYANNAIRQAYIDACGPNSISHIVLPLIFDEAWMEAEAASIAAQSQWRGVVELQVSNETWNPAFAQFGGACAAGIASGYALDGIVRGTLDDLPPAPDASNWRGGYAKYRYLAARTLRASQILAKHIGRDRVRPLLDAQCGNMFGQEWYDAGSWQALLPEAQGMPSLVLWQPFGDGECLLDYAPKITIAPYTGIGMTTTDFRAMGGDPIAWTAWHKRDLDGWLPTFRRVSDGFKALYAANGRAVPDFVMSAYEGGNSTILDGLSNAERVQANACNNSAEFEAFWFDALTDLSDIFYPILMYVENGAPYGPSGAGWGLYHGQEKTAAARALERLTHQP